MSTGDVVRLAFALCCLMPRASAAQVPAELLEAMRARDEALAKADADTWNRFTTADFTDVRTDGILLTRAERLALLKTQTPRLQSSVNKCRLDTTTTFTCAGRGRSMLGFWTSG
jgi:hypothetical protein